MTDTIHDLPAEAVEELPIPEAHTTTGTAGAHGREPAGPGLDVAVRERRGEVIRPLDLDELEQAFAQYQALARRVISPSDLQEAGWDKKKGRQRYFVKKGGLLKIAAAFDLDVALLRTSVDRDQDGTIIRAEAWVRVTHRGGRHADGDGYCDVHEDRFARAEGKTKLEHDLRATATTRATKRGIENLLGLGDIDEDVIAPERPAEAGLEHGPRMVDATHSQPASEALLALCQGDIEDAKQRWNAIRTHLGYMPAAVADALILAAGHDLPAQEPTPPAS